MDWIRISILLMGTLLASCVVGGELHRGAALGELDILKKALEGGANIDELDGQGETALHRAVLGREPHAVGFLLDNGADPYALNSQGYTALHVAITKERKKSAAVLVQRGVKPRTLHSAAYLGDVIVLKELIKAGKDVNEDNRVWRGWSPLDHAAKMGQIEAAKVLIENGAELNKEPSGVYNPLFLSVSNGQHELAEELLRQGMDIDIASRHHGTVLHQLMRHTNIESIRFLLKHGAEVNTITDGKSTPLHAAIFARRPKIVALLLDYGADVNVEDRYGRNAMLHAVEWCEDDIVRELHRRGVRLEPKTYKERNLLHYAVLVERKDLVLKLLSLSRGRSITGRNDRGNMTPLELASRYGKVDMAEFLFANSTIDLTNRDHSRAMKCAVQSGNAQIVELLVKHGAPLERVVASRQNLLALAIEEKHPEVLKALIENGAKLSQYRTNEGLLNLAVRKECEGAVRVLLEAGVKVNVSNEFSVTPLLKAVESGNVEIVRTLLEYGADVHIVSLWNTMIHAAVQTGNCELVELLIEYGVRVDAVPEGAEYPVMERIKNFFRSKKRPKAMIYPTALHFAIVKDDREMVKILLENGANLKALNEYGESALEYASRAGSEKMNELVVSYKRAAARKKSVCLLGGGLVCAVLLLWYFKTRRRDAGDMKERAL